MILGWSLQEIHGVWGAAGITLVHIGIKSWNLVGRYLSHSIAWSVSKPWLEMSWESTSCKFCSGDNHINAFDDPSICSWFSQWLHELQTLQLTQPHLFHHHTSTKWLCLLQALQLTQPHHFSTIRLTAISQVAVSLANFAVITATSLSAISHLTMWLCHLQTLQLTQPHLFHGRPLRSIVFKLFGIYEVPDTWKDTSKSKSYVIRSKNWEKLQSIGTVKFLATLTWFTFQPSATSFPPSPIYQSGCVTCKLCSQHSHITFHH